VVPRDSGRTEDTKPYQQPGWRNYRISIQSNIPVAHLQKEREREREKERERERDRRPTLGRILTSPY
jgi:hypothetical protein